MHRRAHPGFAPFAHGKYARGTLKTFDRLPETGATVGAIPAQQGGKIV